MNKPAVAIALFIMLILPPMTFALGKDAENDRLYIKCLTANSEMPYNKAIAFCKEQVK